jgi:hypothetical protein
VSYSADPLISPFPTPEIKKAAKSGGLPEHIGFFGA